MAQILLRNRKSNRNVVLKKCWDKGESLLPGLAQVNPSENDPYVILAPLKDN